jgi:anti-sigma B factor antagonist
VSVHRLCVTQDLTIYTALEVKPLLLEALTANGGVELDLSQVAEIDTAGVQLLILLKREAQLANKICKIIAHSPAVHQTIDFCNLAAFFGDPMVISASERV